MQNKKPKIKIILQRQFFTEKSTCGEVFIDNKHFCWSLEDMVRPEGIKILGKTAIPYGEYQLTLSYSERFKRNMILLLKVPGFSGVRIHGGNTSEDTEGCLIVAFNKINNDKVQGTAEKAIFEYVKKKLSENYDVWISIEKKNFEQEKLG